MESRMLPLSLLLLLLLLLAVLGPARGAPPGPQPHAQVPVSQLRMLSLGLAHLLQGVEENAARLELQTRQAAAELDGAAHSLEGLSKQSGRAGRSHRQVRKEQQMWRARGDQLWRTLRDLQARQRDAEAERGAMQRRLERLHRRAKGLSGPGSKGQRQLHLDSIQAIMDKQARRLAALTSDLSARDAVMDRHLQQLEQLERELPAAIRPDCVRR